LKTGKSRPRGKENIKFSSLVIAMQEDVQQKFLLTFMKTSKSQAL
jgi:hypothetical protein